MNGKWIKSLMATSLAVGMLATGSVTTYAAGNEPYFPDSGSFTAELVDRPLLPNNQSSSTNSSVPTPDANDYSAGEAYAEKWRNLDTSKFAEQVLELVNKEREKVGLPALETDATLTNAAQIRARELETLYSHDRPNGEKWSTVFDEVSTTLTVISENIAWGQRSPEKVMESWMNSPGHRANILREEAVYIGIAVHKGEKGNLFWTQTFAKD